MADNPTYETTYYCLEAETDSEKILKYTADSYSPLTPTGVVKVDGTHLQITFDRELEYATTIPARDGGSGISMVGTQACSKFKVDDNGDIVGVTKVVPLASPTGAGDRRTFYAVELELEKIVSNSATASYDPEQGGHNNSLALADPNAGKLTGKFGPVSAAAPQSQLKTLALDAAVSGQSDGTLMDENTPMEPTRIFEESITDDKVSSVVMTFTLDKESDWSVSVNGAAPNPGAKAANGSVNVGLKEGWNRITLTVGDISQPGFVTYEIWLYKGTPAYSPVTSITLESESGEHFVTITPTDGNLQYYPSIPGSCWTVVVKVAANDDPQSIRIEGEDTIDTNEGKATVYNLVAGKIRTVKITVTSKTGETASYSVVLNSRNDDVKLDGLKVYMIDEKKDKTELTLIQDDNGSGAVTGFNKDLAPNAQGYRGYNVQLGQLLNIEKYRFIVVPTVETNMMFDTEVFVSTEKGRRENPIKSGEESKKFTINGQGKTLPVYITMSRHNPSTGGTDISDYKVRVNLVSQNVEPRLLSLKLYDKFETKDVLKLSQTELNGNEKLFKTEPNSLKFTLSAEIPDDKTITLETNLDKDKDKDKDKDSYTILDGKLTAAINMVWGEKREIRFTVSNTATGRKYDYKLNLQQGYAGKPFIYLGITPEELSKIWLNGSGPSFRINGISSCIQFDLPTEPGGNRKFSYIVKSDISRFDNLSTFNNDKDGGSGVMTVGWAVFPPLGQEENPPSFKIASMAPDAEPGTAPIDWMVGNTTVNTRRTGGTVTLYFSNQSKKAFTYTRSYEPLAEDRKDGIGEILDRLYPVYLQASLPDGRERQGEFAWIKTSKLLEFPPIVANLVEKNPLKIIEFTAEKTPPLTGISILAYGDTTVVQAGANYQFKIVPDLKTYGQYRKYDKGNFAKKYPNAMCAEGWKWMFATPWFPMQAQVDFYKYSHPGAGDDVYDAVDIDYSSDPIKWGLTGTGDAFKDPTDVSEYATVDQNGIVHAKKHLPMGSLIRLWATTKRLERRAYIDIIHENAGDVSTNRENKFAFIALSPRMAFYGADFQYDSIGGKDYWNKWATVVAEQWLDCDIRRGKIAWCNLRNTGKEKDHTIFLGSGKLKLQLIGLITPSLSNNSGKSAFSIYDDWPLEKYPIGDVIARIPRYQPYQIAMADFLEKTYKDKNNLFNPPMTVEVSGYPIYGTNIIKNDFTFIVETGSQAEIKSSIASNALRQIRGNSSQDDEGIPASERGRWDLEEHHVLSELNMMPEEAGLSEDIVMYTLSDGRTGINMLVGGEEDSGGVSEEGGRKSAVAGGSVMAAADEIEWIYPDIPGAEEVSVIYGDGTPVSSDFSLYYNKVKELSEKEASGARASRSSSAIPKLAPMKISFAVDSNAFDDLELLGFNYKMKGSDEVYCVKAQGTGANGGFSFSDAAEEEKKKELAASSGGGCNGGFAGLLALFAAVLPLCAIKRGRS